MNAALRGTGPGAPLVIDADDLDNLIFWSLALELSVEELRQAVELVGPGVKDVVVWLARRRGGRSEG